MVLPLKDNDFTNKAQLINIDRIDRCRLLQEFMKNSEGITNSDRRRGTAFEFVLNSFVIHQEFFCRLAIYLIVPFKIWSENRPAAEFSQIPDEMF